MKLREFMWWSLALIIILIVLFKNPRAGILREDAKANNMYSAKDEKWEKEKAEQKKFDKDFAFVCDRIAQRDLEIYSLAEKHDREILADVERLAQPTNHPNEYRVKLETRLKQRLNSHIEECIRFRSRIREWRSGASVHWLRADIYQTKCDCDCCSKD